MDFEQNAKITQEKYNLNCNRSQWVTCPTVRSRRQSGNRHRHPSGNGNGSASGESTCSSTTSHCYNTWLPINPPMLPMAVGGPAHECCVSAPEENLRSYDPTDIHLGGCLAREFEFISKANTRCKIQLIFKAN